MTYDQLRAYERRLHSCYYAFKFRTLVFLLVVTSFTIVWSVNLFFIQTLYGRPSYTTEHLILLTITALVIVSCMNLRQWYLERIEQQRDRINGIVAARARYQPVA